MVFTRKFSQFIPVPVDDIVGLTNGSNSISANSGGGAGSLTRTIVQPLNGLNPGEWVTVNLAGLYVLAQADSAQDAEVAGVVISIDPPSNSFVVQQAGSLDNVFVGLIPGTPYFLDPTIPGNMVPMDVTDGNLISRPVFYADTPTGGWVLPYRGFIASGAGPSSGGGTGGDTTSRVPVVQNGHGLIVGDIIRIETPAGGQVQYVLAQANTFGNSLAVGFVVQIIDANNFVYQTSGYILQSATITPPLVDDLGAPLIAKNLYYLSDTVAGRMTNVEPASPNYSRPMYIPEQTIATTGVNAGIILEERSLLQGAAPPPPTPTIVQTTSGAPIDITASGWVDTGICATITTTSALQRVMVMGNLNLASDGANGVAFRVARNGTPIDIGNAAGTRTRASGNSFGTPAQLDSGIGLGEFYLDSPAAAGVYTYCFEVFRGNSSQVSVNKSAFADANATNFIRTSSSILLWIV